MSKGSVDKVKKPDLLLPDREQVANTKGLRQIEIWFSRITTWSQCD